MSNLYLGIALLLTIALLFLYLPARRQSERPADSQLHRGAQRRFYQQRQTELNADRDAGLIDSKQYAELERELDRQLMAESATNAEGKQGRRNYWLILALGLAIPLSALFLYSQFGYRQDLQLRSLQREIVETGMTEERWQRYQDIVADILAQRPDSGEHLVMMATLFRQQGDFAGALPYYERLETVYPDDADVLGQLAQARYLVNDRVVDEKTRQLLERALAINPQQATALGVLGINAFAAARYVEALGYWQRLLIGLSPNSAEAGVIAGGVAEAKRRAIAAGNLRGLPVTVTLSPELGDVPDGVLFVVAKSRDGTPMPVAATRLPLTGGSAGPEWPLTLYLTDGDVIRQGKVLADFPELIVSAHISLAGTAIRRPGDWLAEPIQIVQSGDKSPQIELNINGTQGAK